MEEYTALGLNSRKTAWGIAIVGLLLAPVGIGLLLIVWGCVADVMLAKHEKQLKLKYASRAAGTATARAKSLSYEEPAKLDDNVTPDFDFGEKKEQPKQEACENCGRAIGKLETPELWKEHVVCHECKTKLAAQSQA